MGRIKGRADEILEEFAERVNKLARINLGATYTEKGSNGKIYRKRIDSSGKLKNSIDYTLETRGDDGKFSRGILNFEMLEYGLYVDRGRKRGKGIPINPLVKWIKKKPLRIRDLETGGFIKATDARVRSLAFLISRKAKMKGIKATNFFTEPLNDEFPKYAQKLTDAAGDDYLSDLDERIDTFNKPKTK